MKEPLRAIAVRSNSTAVSNRDGAALWFLPRARVPKAGTHRSPGAAVGSPDGAQAS
jgi:hypothetical protein